MGSVIAIGIDRYDPPIRVLNAGVNDARAIAAAFAARCRLVPTVLDDGRASAEAIARCLRARAAADRERAQLVLYFAGHADVHRLPDGRLEGVLLPSGARLDDPSTLLPMRALRDLISDLGYRHVLVILDCCCAAAFSLGVTRGLGGEVTAEHFERYRSLPSAQFIASAAADEEAADTFTARTYLFRPVADGVPDAAVHSPFAEVLLDAVRDFAADEDRDGVITGTDLAAWTGRTFRQKLGGSPWNRQTVCFSTLDGHDGGEFLIHDGRALAAPIALDEDTCPWPGIKPYAGEHRLCGRAAFRADLIARLPSQRPAYPGVGLRGTILVGPSGTGKTSILSGELVPALLAQGATLRSPAGDAVADLDALLEAVEAPGAYVLVIDGIERYIAQPGGAERLAVLGRNAAAKGWSCFGTVREDYESRLGALAALVVPVPDVTAEDLRDCILRPAHEHAIFFERAAYRPADADGAPIHHEHAGQALVDRIVHDVMGRGAPLPTLSTCLEDMYLRMIQTPGRRELTHADYDAVGGCAGALIRRSDQFVDGLAAEERSDFMWIVARLVHQEGMDFTLKSRPRRALAIGSKSGPLLARGLEQRVLMAARGAPRVDGDATVLEIGHERLVRGWARIGDFFAPASATGMQIAVVHQLVDDALTWL